MLIVDDDRDIAEVIEAVLENEGYPCRRVSNGEEALAEAAAARPALVLLDMRMPRMDGWACARALRGSYGDELPIVIMTGAQHAEDERRETDADAALTKPFELETLLEVVERFVH